MVQPSTAFATIGEVDAVMRAGIVIGEGLPDFTSAPPEADTSAR